MITKAQRYLAVKRTHQLKSINIKAKDNSIRTKPQLTIRFLSYADFMSGSTA